MRGRRRQGGWLLAEIIMGVGMLMGRCPVSCFPDPPIQDKAANIQIQGGAVAGTLRDGYISLNLEFFPETFPALASPKIRFLMSQLHPAYLRIGGNSADSTAYNFTGVDEAACSRQQFCFGPEELQDLTDFSKAINWQVIFNLNEYYPYPDPVVDPDAGGRTLRPGPLVLTNTKPLLQYMAANPGLAPLYVTLGNELTDNLKPDVTAQDYIALADAMGQAWAANNPDAKPKLIGPDCFWQNRTWLDTFLAEPGLPDLSILTWHLYLLNRTAEPDRILDPEVLDTAAHWASQYRLALANASKPWDLWLTETGCAWGGELSGVADSFIGGFWWLDQLGLLAREGVVVQHRHTVFAYTPQWASSFLGTKEQNFEPRPDYWTSLLWGRLVGKTVLNVNHTVDDPSDRNLRVYAHCSVAPGGVVLIVINLSKDTNYYLTINEDAAFQGSLNDKQAYLLSAPTFDSQTVLLNGQPLSLTAIDEDDFAFSGLQPVALQGDVVVIPPLTYGFVVLPDAEPLVCHPDNNNTQN